MQAAIGSLLGGPVGLIYFLRQNFMALGNTAAARKTLIFGVVLIIALIVVLPLLPENFPSTPFNLMYIFVARGVADKYQLSKQGIIDSADYRFQSSWKVFGMGLLCLLGSAVAIIGPSLLLAPV
jgi:hypothetical protein